MNNIAVIVILAIIATVNSFPDGAPPDTCVKERFNQPNHGQYRTQSLETLPYRVTASAAYYQPGDQIVGEFNFFKLLQGSNYVNNSNFSTSVSIEGKDVFRGFFFQGILSYFFFMFVSHLSVGQFFILSRLV